MSISLPIVSLLLLVPGIGIAALAGHLIGRWEWKHDLIPPHKIYTGLASIVAGLLASVVVGFLNLSFNHSFWWMLLSLVPCVAVSVWRYRKADPARDIRR